MCVSVYSGLVNIYYDKGDKIGDWLFQSEDIYDFHEPGGIKINQTASSEVSC